MNERTNEWMYEWSNERTNWWMNVWINKWTNERTNKWTNEWMNERRNKWTNEWMNERMNEWMNERTNDQMNEWMNEWMNERGTYIVRITQSLMALYTLYTTRPDVSVYKAPLAAAFSPFLVSLFPAVPMTYGVKDQTTTPSTPCPTLFDIMQKTNRN